MTAMPLESVFDKTPAHYADSLKAANPLCVRLLDGDYPVAIHPAGRLGQKAAVWLLKRGVRVVCFSDNNVAKQGQKLLNWPVVAPANVPNFANIFVASSIFDTPIREQFHALGRHRVVSYALLAHFFPDAFGTREYQNLLQTTLAAKDSILKLNNLLADEESKEVLRAKVLYNVTFDQSLLGKIRSKKAIYFGDVMPQQSEDVVADCGAFTGDTLADFLELRAVYGHYYAFEPDPASFGKLTKLASPSVTCVPSGVADKTGTAHFAATEVGYDSEVLDCERPGSTPVKVVALDDYFRDKQPPTIIKMDIEGSERKALAGARRLIAEASPSIAASVYHYPCDLWELPLLLHEMMPKANLYLRHYTNEIQDTVCYAIARKS